MSRLSVRRELAFIGVAALALLAGGVWMASLRLPEWRAQSIPPPSFFTDRVNEAARRAGLVVLTQPTLTPTSRFVIYEEMNLSRRDPAYDALGPAAPEWLTSRGYGPFVVSSADVRGSGREADRLTILFSIRGEPISGAWTQNKPSGDGAPTRASNEIAALLVPPTLLGTMETASLLGQDIKLFPIRGTAPAEYIVAATIPAVVTESFAVRAIGSVPQARERLQQFNLETLIRQLIPQRPITGLVFFASALLFIFLLVKRRLDITTGAIVAVLSLIFSVHLPLSGTQSWLLLLDALGNAIGKVVAVFVIWCAAESWIRTTTPDFRTNLDALRAGRIGHSAGRALLSGWFFGAACAGVGLIAMTLMTYAPGVSPLDGSIHLPAFDKIGSPVAEGALRAGYVLLAIAGSLLIPGLRRLGWIAAVVLGGIFLATRFPISAFWFCMLMGVAMAALLVLAYHRFGLASLLTASVVAIALPVAIFAIKHFSWLPATALAASAIAAAPLLAGAIGLRRTEEITVEPPRFVRRLEQERRLQYEMDLLARMQIGLLPQQTPKIDGYEIAAKSLLATEAGGDLYDFVTDQRGRIWIAAGDVSGHGFSCAIAQAMTKAGLASLIDGDQTPATVLARLDRVLRGSGSSRTFTTLALLRLDSTRGEGLLANAGHPYPLQVSNGEVHEFAISSLPLGQGPARSYENVAVTIAPGSAIVFCSDGVFEATNERGAAYGFDRIRQVLLNARGTSAEELLTRILADWRQHLGASKPADDTTVVVLLREI